MTRTRLCLADWLALAYILLAPLYYFLPVVPGLRVNPVRLVGVGLCVLACLYTVKYLPRRYSARMWASLLAATVTIRILISMTSFGHMDVLGETFSLTCLLALLLTASAPPSRLPVTTWLTAMAIGGAVGGVLALATQLHLVPIPAWSRTEAIFLNERTGWCVDTGVGVLGQFACVILIMGSSQRKTRLAGIICLPLAWLPVILAQFRTYLACALLLSAIAITLSMRRRKQRRHLLILGASLGLLALLAFWDPSGHVNDFLTRFQDKGTALDSIRHNEIQEELLLISDHALWGMGYGVGRSETHYTSGIGSMPLFGHNLFTSTTLRVGIPIASLILAGWTLLGWMSWRRMRVARTSIDQLVAYGGVGVVVMVLLAGRYLNLFTMTIMAPGFALFLAPALADPVNRRRRFGALH